jgi:hypothetical protein
MTVLFDLKVYINYSIIICSQLFPQEFSTLSTGFSTALAVKKAEKPG